MTLWVLSCKKLDVGILVVALYNNNNNNTSICKVHNVSIRAESEAPGARVARVVWSFAHCIASVVITSSTILAAIKS